MAAIPQTGDAVRLYQSLLSATWYGIVSDGDTPPMNCATLEAVDGEAVITTDVLVGPRGEPGRNAPIVELEWPPPTNSGDLPMDWPEAMKNHGFLIGGLLWVWTGYRWESALPGPAGPPGATPQVTFTFETIPMAERGPGVTDEVIASGTSLRPHIHGRLLSPQGPQGPSTNIAGAPDYDPGSGASPGKVLTVFNNGKWGPSEVSVKHPHLYTFPEQAFQNFTGMAQRHTILSGRIEAQDFDWIPFVTGHVKVFGLELDRDPLTVGCEVRLNPSGGASDALTGTLIGRSHGNISNWSTVVPHFSSTGDPTSAAAPGNNVGLVAAGQEAIINMSIVNDGLIGTYIYNRNGSQLGVLTIPAD